jgi:putative CocE/NonD family hydrolase
MRTPLLLLFALAPAYAQPTVNAAYVRENYSKFEYRIPMRDGLKLFTAVYIPKDGGSYPIMMMRTPYSVRPYGEDQFPASLGPSEFFTREKFIFVYQDIRGRYMSEGVHIPIRPFNPNKKTPQDVDESSDSYDTIDWLVKHVPNNTGKVGVWGISQPGFYATAAMLSGHPALVAGSPQAPVTDYYLGDDVYHNGAFMLAANFGFYQGFRPRDGDPALPPAALPVDYGTPDGYDFYLSLGSLANSEEKFFKHKNPWWSEDITNTAYNEYWQSRSIWKHLTGIKPAAMVVGGWFDAEDLQGPLRTFDFMEHHTPPATNMLVMGPWTHGGFARGEGDKVGNVSFGSNTSAYFREHIEFPFFRYQLKGKGDGKFPRAWVFQTGVNQWRKFDSWPPKDAQPETIYLDAKGKLSLTQPAAPSIDEYVSDPNKPAPYIGHVLQGMRFDYMTEDQRFASTRTDVLVYKSEVLDHDVTVTGPIGVDLKVATSGTDSDFVVKLIDVYPNDYPETEPPPANPRLQPANAIHMGGYEQLVRGEPFRGKYRKSFEKPVPFEPNKPDRITYNMPDVCHTFRTGHRIMVQVQSSWFPLTDRNPQKFMDIPNAHPEDFVKATERLYLGGPEGSKITLPVSIR